MSSRVCVEECVAIVLAELAELTELTELAELVELTELVEVELAYGTASLKVPSVALVRVLSQGGKNTESTGCCTTNSCCGCGSV